MSERGVAMVTRVSGYDNGGSPVMPFSLEFFSLFYWTFPLRNSALTFIGIEISEFGVFVGGNT